jgi:transcription termination/antitermination protein NusA
MDNKEILLIAEAVSHEKGVDKQVIFEALEQALATATKKRYDEESDIVVKIDPSTGDYKTYRQWLVVPDDQLAILGTEFTTEEAFEENPDLNVGDVHQEEVPNVKYGRIAAQIAKQVIIQKVREAEKAQMVDQYKDRVGCLVNGSVKKVTRDNVFVDLSENAEAVLPRSQLIPREVFRVGERIRAILHDVRTESRGPQLVLSRTCPEMLIELFKIEVPEISEEVIEIRSAAREPGVRAKIAVKTNDGRIDPIGACVGMRGSRVQVVSNELNSERVDIVLWDDNPAQLVINAMSPAEVESIVVDEDTNSMDVAVAEDSLARAIGSGGQNVRMVAELTGWKVNIMTVSESEARQEAEGGVIIKTFMEKLDIEEDVALVLVEEGFASIEELAYVPVEELASIDGFDEDIAEELRARANDKLLAQAISSEDVVESARPANDLINMEGMDLQLAYFFASKGIVCMEDLAEQAVDDLISFEGVSEEQAAKLIMTAREPWFAQEK